MREIGSRFTRQSSATIKHYFDERSLSDLSYDLLVFEPSSAPQDQAAFLQWYQRQTEWSENRDYNDPGETSPKLAAWFAEMTKTFPPMNGPIAVDDDRADDPEVTDYSIGTAVIYAAFAWSEADKAREMMLSLGIKHQVGFFDCSADDGTIWRP